MSYFLYNGEINPNQVIRLKDQEAQHLLKSRRIRIGEIIELQDSLHHRFLARIDTMSPRELTTTVLEKIQTPDESPLRINLYQALIKEKPMDFVLQKATELGASTINIFQSQRSQRLKKGTEKQLLRWQKICLEACKQSGRTIPPPVRFFERLSDPGLIRALAKTDHPIIRFEQFAEGETIYDLPEQTAEISILIGPEGGWHGNEICISATRSMNLGPRTLRAETAAIAAISILQYHFGDMSEKKIQR